MPNLEEEKENILINDFNCLKCNNKIEKSAIETLFYKENRANLEKVLKYPLWLQEDFKRSVFWAYNYEHLSYLKNFVEAKIRKRVENRIFMTMIEKLPKFIKNAKNRVKLLKLIEKLESK